MPWALNYYVVLLKYVQPVTNYLPLPSLLSCDASVPNIPFLLYLLL